MSLTPVFFTPTAKAAYQTLPKFPVVERMYSRYESLARMMSPQRGDENVRTMFEAAYDDVLEIASKDKEAKELFNSDMLKNLLDQIKRIVALNCYTALHAINQLGWTDFQEAGENALNDSRLLNVQKEGDDVLKYAMNRDFHSEKAQKILDEAAKYGKELTKAQEKQYLDEIKLSNESELERRLSLRRLENGKRHNLERVKEAGLEAEYEYVYGIPKEPPKWESQKVSVKPVIPATVYVNLNKLTKLAGTKPAARAMRIYENNLVKNPSNADEALVRAVEREFSALSVEQRQLLAANLKYKVDQKLAGK